MVIDKNNNNNKSSTESHLNLCVKNEARLMQKDVMSYICILFYKKVQFYAENYQIMPMEFTIFFYKIVFHS